MRLITGAALAILASSGVFAAEPIARQPTGKWQMNFGRSRCVAMRDYGTAENPLILLIKASPLGGLMQVSVITRSRGRITPHEVPGTIRFDQAMPIRTSILVFTGKSQNKLRSARINLPSNVFTPMRTASAVEFNANGVIEEVLALSPMPKLTEHLDRCLIELRNEWNSGPTPNVALVTRAASEKPLEAYLRSEDYPAHSIAKRESGDVGLVVLVDETGKVADCTVTETSGEPVLDAQSCALIEARAHFSPAAGADGKPARDVLTAKIRWRMPN